MGLDNVLIRIIPMQTGRYIVYLSSIYHNIALLPIAMLPYAYSSFSIILFILIPNSVHSCCGFLIYPIVGILISISVCPISTIVLFGVLSHWSFYNYTYFSYWIISVCYCCGYCTRYGIQYTIIRPGSALSGRCLRSLGSQHLLVPQPGTIISRFDISASGIGQSAF